MENQDFTITFSTSKSPQEVYNAINNVRDWWKGEIAGDSHQTGDEFTYRYKELHYSKQHVAELIPGKKVVWDVPDASLTFVNNTTEWKGTRITFDITAQDGSTQVRFTHEGLKPQLECYSGCSAGWSHYIGNSLPQMIDGASAEGDNSNTP